VTDLLLFLKILRPDGTTDTRRVRLPVDGACELRLRFHEGHFAKALLLRGLRLAAESPVESPQGNAASATKAAVLGNDNH
jgi:hypothetical protein